MRSAWLLVAAMVATACKGTVSAPSAMDSRSGSTATGTPGTNDRGEEASAAEPDAPPASGSRAIPPLAPGAREMGCSLPSSPSHLVLVIHRDILPIGPPITHEEAQLTVDGACEPQTECAHVTPSQLRAVAGLVRAASPIHVYERATSPHYGFRSIAARWDGGSCVLSDGINAPIAERDSPAFYAAFDAIAQAVVEARPDARAPVAP